MDWVVCDTTLRAPSEDDNDAPPVATTRDPGVTPWVRIGFVLMLYVTVSLERAMR